ncbi:MAG: hypothetical protein ACFCUE_04825 [Candidatus Bathyarchaeia archaeon]|jgi:hypothetical protein
MLEYLVFVAAFASLAAAAAYIRSMFKGNTMPNRVTWLMWSIAPLIATAAAVSTGVTLAVLPVFMAGFSPLLIFIASFFTRKAYWKLTKVDYLCGVLSGLALVLWYVTQEPNLAIVLAIISDAFAAFPTLIKAWENPQTESVWPYLVGIFGPLTSFAAATVWGFSELAFPVYLIAVNCLLVSALYHKKEANLAKT